MRELRWRPGEPFLRVHWVAVPEELRARRVNNRGIELVPVRPAAQTYVMFAFLYGAASVAPCNLLF